MDCRLPPNRQKIITTTTPLRPWKPSSPACGSACPAETATSANWLICKPTAPATKQARKAASLQLIADNSHTATSPASDSLRSAGTTRPPDGASSASAATVTVTVPAAQPDSSLHCTAAVTCDRPHCTSDSADFGGACAADFPRASATDTNAGACATSYSAGIANPAESRVTLSHARISDAAPPGAKRARTAGLFQPCATTSDSGLWPFTAAAASSSACAADSARPPD